MPASEQDLDLLETLLDGEIADEQANALRQRVSGDPELSLALDRIRVERAMRQQIWREMEPQEAQVATLVSGVRAAIQRDEVWSRRQRALRYVSGLAACITLGFLVGRYLPYGPMQNADPGSGVVFEPQRGPVMEVRDQPSMSGPFKVLLTDANGRVIAEQPFNTLDEAREFTDDINRLQPGNTMRPMRVSDTIHKKGQF